MNVLGDDLPRPFRLIFCNEFGDEKLINDRRTNTVAPTEVRFVSLIRGHGPTKPSSYAARAGNVLASSIRPASARAVDFKLRHYRSVHLAYEFVTRLAGLRSYGYE